MAYDMTNDEIVEAASRLTPQWLAGFFDGEGCVCVHKCASDFSFTFQVTVSQAEPKILALIALKFGLSVNVSKSNGRRMFVARAMGRGAIPFLEYIKDHVVCKRRQVEAALEFASTLNKTGGFTLSVEQTTTRSRLAEVIRRANNGVDTSLEVTANNG